MPSSVSASKNSRRGRPATGKGQQIGVRLQPDMLTAVDAYAARHDDEPSRAEAIRRILQDWLTSNGLLSPSSKGSA